MTIADYEHSGDSQLAYQLLRRNGITDTWFRNNGDGNTAYIEFSMPYDEVRVDALIKDFYPTFYTLGFVNLYEFQTIYARLGITFPKDTLTKEIYDKVYNALPYHPTDAMGNYDVFVEIKGYNSQIALRQRVVDEMTNVLKNDFKCPYTSVWVGDMEFTYRGVTTLENVLKMLRKGKEIKFNDLEISLSVAFHHGYGSFYGFNTILRNKNVYIPRDWMNFFQKQIKF